MDKNDAIAALMQAIKLSPDSLPLREHLADQLMSLERFEDAKDEYAFALKLDPDNARLKVALANAFYQLSKYSHAEVILEELVKTTKPPAGAHLLNARLLLNDGHAVKAAEHYQKAVAIDASIADQSLAESLKVDAGKGFAEWREAVYEAIDEEELNEIIGSEKPSITFEQVGGMENVKEQIRMKIIYPISNAGIFAAYGKRIGGGVLMYGPPGCGKTHLARATAGEIKATFISVGISDVLDMWLGNSERNLHELFEQARRRKPCVLFFDEVDALAASRADMRTSSARLVINQFLVEMDGIDGDNEGILILGATNAPWHLDSAFRRRRFDRIIFVAPPDTLARAEIFRIVLSDKPTDPKIDFGQLAKKAERYSGADIQNVIDVVVEKKLVQAMKTGQPIPITMRDLEDALKAVKPSTLEWMSTAKNYATYSNQGGIYDDVLDYLKSNKSAN